ncbi:30S ribosomal protein S8 [Candidatus Parcubacteria bacterium]|uniref:Small ribosomal subunit protein uS8 n=1 Tax=Candidatus Kaiserbacteria bacterium CG10_big_fil_rev_8_21_14_0_10_47_16 TaxID=1974608 RepID=A0A2H0UFX5_9BACT|nr:30S ribosomal protein S8 [Candidatus Parcubacteria bacterium]PIR84586.1 MAG: 30S ribosomal protein S8 [Candidatus Kaiserbacteria bacterium CG10_big_fil_rev_8_21_14_0_10_47_16]
MVGDPVGDFIIQLKNAGMVGKMEVNLPYSKLKAAIADKLAEAGFVASAEKRGKKVKKTLDVVLKYDERGDHAIRGVQRISKPGRRLYIGVSDIHPVKFGKGKRILSTPAGILTGEEAREKNVGGEELFIIW